MFTGIIQEIGIIKNIIRENNLKKFLIKAKSIKKGLKTGASVSVNGVCLTVVSIKWDHFTVEAVEATLKGTNLDFLNAGNQVNLETALSATSKLDGHFVTGHVDCMGIIIKKQKIGEQENFYIKVPEQFLAYLVAKGSICVDGISLTIAKTKKNVIKIVVIPYTVKNTNLGKKQINQAVNIEFDILGKYAIARMDSLVNPETKQNRLEAKLLEFSNFIYRGSLN